MVFKASRRVHQEKQWVEQGLPGIREPDMFQAWLQPQWRGVGRRGFVATCELTCMVGWRFCGGCKKREENDMVAGNCLMV